MEYEVVYTEVISRLIASGLSEEKAILYLDKIIDENIKKHFIKLIKRMRENEKGTRIN